MKFHFNLSTLLPLFCGCLWIPASGLAQIPISGVSDETVYVDQVTFTISSQSGYTYDARLDGNPLRWERPCWLTA